MTMNKISTFLTQMRYRAGTGELNGLRDFRIGGMAFRLNPPMDDGAAYALFDYLVEMSKIIDDSAAATLCLNTAAYLVDNDVGFKIQFRWDWIVGIKENLAYFANVLGMRKLVGRMRNNRKQDPSIAYLPTVDAVMAKKFGRKETSA